MWKILLTTIIIIGLALIFFFGAKYTEAEIINQDKLQITIQETPERIVNITTMSVTVKQSSCRECLESELSPSFCLDICKQTRPEAVLTY